MSADLGFIDDSLLFAPSPSPLSHMSRSPTPPHNEVVPKTADGLAAVVSPVIVTLDNEVLMQEGTPEPEMVPITTGRRRGQLRKKPAAQGYWGESLLLTYAALDEKPTIAAVHTEFAKHRYRFRELIGCFERHKATHDANGEVVEEGSWHMHIFGHLFLNATGSPPNIKNGKALDIKLNGPRCYGNMQPVRNHTDFW